MSPLRLNGSTSGYSQIDAPAIAGDQTFTLPGTGGTLDRLNRAGNILQVVQAIKTDTASTTSTTFAEIAGLTVSITPSSSTNKILLMTTVYSSSDLSVSSAFFAFGKNASVITAATGDAAGSRPRIFGSFYSGDLAPINENAIGPVAMQYLDSPGTSSAITYSVMWRNLSLSATASYLNRTLSDRNTSNYDVRCASSLIAMEVAA